MRKFIHLMKGKPSEASIKSFLSNILSQCGRFGMMKVTSLMED